MMCFKHLLPYALLLPMSSASPVFMLLFTVYLFYSVRPCGYCLALISILFLSTSPSSPFISLVPPPLDVGNTESLLASHRRTWYDLNHGNIFDPVIKAFSPDVTSRKTTRSGATASTVPAGYTDLRWRGLGMIVNFGWKRSEEGMEWEMEDWRETRRRYGEELPQEQKAEGVVSGEAGVGQDAVDATGMESTHLDRAGWADRILGRLRWTGGKGLLSDW